VSHIGNITAATNHTSGYWIVLVAYFAGVLPLAVGWYFIASNKECRNWWNLACLVIGTLSMAWLALGVMHPIAMGAYYSHERYAIIETNLGLTFLAGILGFGRPSMFGVVTGIGCLLLSLTWLCVLIINSVV
jgi:hypothetical protein